MDTEQQSLVASLVALRRRWRVVLAAAAPVALVAVLYGQSLPTTWSATSTVAFAPRPGASVGADTVGLVVPSYVALLSSPAVLAEVGQRVGRTPAELASSVDLSVPPTTATLVTVVVGATPQEVALTANALAHVAVDRARTDPVLSATLVSAAVPPLLPAGPARRLAEVAGVLAGLVLGLVLAAALDRGIPRVRGAEGGLPGTPLLARVPRRDSLDHPAAEALDDPALARPVGGLRDRLTVLRGSAPVLVVAVCSAGRREGRTTVAALLAQSFARTGARVLLVDADLHRAALSAEYVLLPSDAWLVDVLAGEAGVSEAAAPTGLPGLWVLPAGTTAAPAVLVTRGLHHLAAALRLPAPAAVPAGPVGAAPGPAAAGFDVVVLDTPPLLDHEEAALLARTADEVVLVAREGSPAGPVRGAVDLLHQAGARTLGLVVTDGVRRASRRRAVRARWSG